MKDAVCTKCESTELVSVTAPTSQVTTFVMIEGQDVVQKNFGNGEMIVTVCKNCGDARLNGESLK